MAPKVSFLDPACSCADITPPSPSTTPSTTPTPACHHHRPNLNEILPGLFLGNLAAAESAETLSAHGITHVLSITSTPPTIPAGYIHKYHHLHDEHSADLLSILPDCVARVEFLLAADDKRVLVHCCMGRSRSAAVVIGYVMKARGCAYEGAFAAVAARRPMVRPNSGFVGMLRVWGACGASPWVGEEMAGVVARARARPRRVGREGSRRRRCLLEEEWVVVEEVGVECWGENGTGGGGAEAWGGGGGFLVGFFLGAGAGGA